MTGSCFKLSSNEKEKVDHLVHFVPYDNGKFIETKSGEGVIRLKEQKSPFNAAYLLVTNKHLSSSLLLNCLHCPLSSLEL